ncbi:hypothetical protein [Mycolicibacter icosiumassiliensis]|uniref:hypothetical protein n=1 Tax=Mycolicibacter icosiumassiliensis TaxID=1792835 RepID=UPI00082C7048|nr:hypothetical protein [Mycolicibacter icosiumassiliensis]
MANWVRFADTKATILAAGLGVVVSLLTNSLTMVVKAVSATCPAKLVVGALAGLTVVSFLWTLVWVVLAITPRNALPYNKLNRFAWPSLVGATADQLATHAEQSHIDADAWQQVVDLAAIAKRKFDACTKAIYGFSTMIVAGVFTLLAAAVFVGP